MTALERQMAADAVALSKEHADRADRAEARLAAVRSVLLEGGQDHVTARRRALAIISDEADPRDGNG